MKIAAIDIGTNSVHMVIVEVARSGSFHVVDRETEMIRLGSGTLSTGLLPDTAIERAIGIMRAYRRLAEMHEVEEILAVATSAVRESRNGEDLLDLIGRKIGVWPRAISGEEEARLIYTAVLHSIHLEGRRALVIDVGGGSVEMALGKGHRVEFVSSLKLGVLRLAEQFASDPLSGRTEKRLAKKVREEVRPQLDRIERFGFDDVVGTSGTILSLGRLALRLGEGERPDSMHHVTVPVSSLRSLRKRLAGLTLKARLRVPGLDRRRADILPVGAVILDTILAELPKRPAPRARQILMCEWALREGILIDYIARHRKALARAAAYPDVRRRSVLAIAERWSDDVTHAKHVAGLSLGLFDTLASRHGLAEVDRSLLEYAALMHDAGHHISHSQHHKHSYYLIKNADLRGFEPLEIEIMANVARYHRRGFPRRKHEAFGALSQPDRRRVRLLAGILRLADGLDRGHRQRIRGVSAARGADGLLRLRCRATGDVELEMWGARRRTDLLEDTLGVKVDLLLPPVRKPKRSRGPSPRRSRGAAKTRASRKRSTVRRTPAGSRA